MKHITRVLLSTFCAVFFLSTPIQAGGVYSLGRLAVRSLESRLAQNFLSRLLSKPPVALYAMGSSQIEKSINKVLFQADDPVLRREVVGFLESPSQQGLDRLNANQELQKALIALKVPKVKIQGGSKIVLENQWENSDEALTALKENGDDMGLNPISLQAFQASLSKANRALGMDVMSKDAGRCLPSLNLKEVTQVFSAVSLLALTVGSFPTASKASSASVLPVDSLAMQQICGKSLVGGGCALFNNGLCSGGCASCGGSSGL